MAYGKISELRRKRWTWTMGEEVDYGGEGGLWGRAGRWTMEEKVDYGEVVGRGENNFFV